MCKRAGDCREYRARYAVPLPPPPGEAGRGGLFETSTKQEAGEDNAGIGRLPGSRPRGDLWNLTGEFALQPGLLDGKTELIGRTLLEILRPAATYLKAAAASFKLVFGS
jgi:hypothetical protein